MSKPLAIDLFCGLGGWADGLLASGYDAVGFDIERHEYGEHRYPGQLVIQDVLTLHGSQFKGADLIVASPPCQEYSYMAMPWSRAKGIAAEYRAGTRDVRQLTALFDACFRIQREACEAAGRHIPLIVENVRGAIPWVGRSRWNFGSYHLWGDVPALMPPTAARAAMKPQPYQRRHGTGSWFAIDMASSRAGIKNPTYIKQRDGADHTKHLTNPAEGRKHHGDWFRDPDCPTRQGGQRGRKYGDDGLKQPGIDLSEVGFNCANAREFAYMVEGADYRRFGDDKRRHIGVTRKFASAMIAKIPLPLATHIATVFRP